MSHALTVRLLALVAALASPLSALAGEAGSDELLVLVLVDSSSSALTTRSWDLALDPASDRPGGALRLGTFESTTGDKPVQAPALTPDSPPAPKATPAPGAVFATLSDNRLSMEAPKDERQARLSQRKATDWSGYAEHERRAGDSLEESMRPLEWPDIEGGSEPIVPAVSRTPDGKRSGLGLGWRF